MDSFILLLKDWSPEHTIFFEIMENASNWLNQFMFFLINCRIHFVEDKILADI